MRWGRPEVAGRGLVAELCVVAGLLLAIAAAGCDSGAVSGGDGADDGAGDDISGDDGAGDDISGDDGAGDDGAGDDGGDGPDAGPTGEGILEDRACPEDSFLTYVSFGSAFFSEYCTGCHSAELPPRMRQDAPEGVDFETLAKIRELAPLIYERAADGYSLMPPAGGPSEEARRLLGDWLACGAPE